LLFKNIFKTCHPKIQSKNQSVRVFYYNDALSSDVFLKLTRLLSRSEVE
jgi:hypothetical protein